MKTLTGLTAVLTTIVLTTATASFAQENQPAAQAEKADRAPMPILRLDGGGPVSQVTSLLFSPDGDTLYAAGYDKAVYAWTKGENGRFQFAPEKTLRIPIGPGVNDGLIKTLAISSDGKYLAAAGVAMGSHVAGFTEGGLMWPFSTQSVEQRKELGTIYVFDLESKEKTKITHLRDHTGQVTMLAFAPQPKQQGQGHVLVSAAEEYDKDKGESHGGLRVWHIEKPEKPIGEVKDLTAPSKKNTLPRAIAAVRTGNAPSDVHVGIAWGEDVVRIWDVSKKRVFDFENLSSFAVAGLKNKILLAAGYRKGKDGFVGWHLSKWQPPVKAGSKPIDTAHPMQDDHAPVGIATTADADVAMIVSYMPKEVNGVNKGDVGFFLLDTNNLTRLPNDGTRAVKFSDSDHRYSFAISPKADYVAVAGNLDRTIQVYPVDRNRQVGRPQALEGQGDLFRRVRFFTKGETLGIGLNRDDRTADNRDAPADLIFNLSQSETEDPAGWQEASSRETVKFTVEAGTNQNRHQLTATFEDGSKTVITLPEKQFIRQYARCPETPNHPPLIATIVYSPDFAESILRVYNAKTGERLRQFSGHTDQILSIAFSPDGKLLASAGMDRTVRVWWMEDLKEHIGSVGFLDYVELTDKQDKATVKEIDQIAAKADVRNSLRENDVISGFVGPDGKFVKTEKSKDFFYYLAAIAPEQAVSLRIERDGRNVVPDPKVQVQQAVDERKPLFTLFFEKGQAEKWSWIGWMPTGPFDSSDREIEKLVGWHFNPAPLEDDPNAASAFAEIGEYRGDHYKKNLLKSLVETGAPPVEPPPESETIGETGNRTDVVPYEEIPPETIANVEKNELPPTPEPVFSLFIQEQHQDPEQGYVPLPLDREQKVWAKTPKLKAIFTVTDYFPIGLDEGLTWELDGKRLDLKATEPESGVFEADLSSLTWQEKAGDKPYLLRVSFTNRPDYYKEQAIVFDPEPEPVPEPMKVLPTLAIAEPDSLTVLYDELNKQEISVTVRLSKASAEAPVQPGRLSFERNGEPVLQNGQPISEAFGADTKEIKVTLPVENGANRFRGRLTASEGEQTALSNEIVVYYRRPPRVSDLNVDVDKLKPRATVTCKIQTPVDRPLTEVLLLVNNKMFMLPDDLISDVADENDKTVRNVSIENVLLVEGENTIRVIPRNADGKVLATPKAAATWTKPEVKPLPSPKVLYVNVNDQVPLGGYWQGDPFGVEFNVLAAGKLDRVLIYYNGERLDEPEIPEAVNGMKYQFKVPVVLSRTKNLFRVIAQDEGGLWGEKLVELNTLKPPVKVVIDQIIDLEKRTVIEPVARETATGPIEFNAKASSPRVVLRGRVITSDSTKKFKRPYVKCWVNGYLQTGQAFQMENDPTEWQFAMNLVLNKNANRLSLEMPEAPEIRASQKECLVMCTKPETEQKLHLVLVGHNPENPADMDMLALEENAKKAFGIQDGKTREGNPAVIHKVPFNLTRNAQITSLLRYIQHSNPNRAKGDHQLVVFYYQGQESDKEDQIVLSTLDRLEGKSAFTAEILKERLEEVHGAHVVMLDVAQPKPVENEWDKGRFLGMVRSIHNGQKPKNFPLASALEDPLKRTRKLNELPALIEELMKQQGLKAEIDSNPSGEIEELELP